MSEFPKATKLSEVAAAVEVTPLKLGDDRYEDLSAGRGGSNELAMLRECLQDYDASQDRFAKVAFTGHRGCGKTTELYRLENKLSDRFTPLHIEVDSALLVDCDYTELFLLMVDELVNKFANEGMPLKPEHVKDIALWFADVTFEKTEDFKSEITAEAGAETEGKAGIPWLFIKLLARVRSAVTGSVKRREKVRQELQRRSSELIRRVNTVLDDAHTVLTRQKRPANLLIVFDQLDRLTPEVSGPFFSNGAEFLKQPKAHIIYTVPVAMNLPPSVNIGTIFDRYYNLSIVKVRNEDGRSNKKGIDTLMEAVARRIEIDAVFSNKKVVRTLAERSGGQLRDLMRLIGDAQLIARVDDKDRIDAASARKAVLRLRLEYERILIPSGDYYPLLAQIHRTKKDPATVTRQMFGHLLWNGSVLAYNGDDVWYDVHPVIQEIDAFKDAFKRAQSDAQAASKPETGEGQARRE